MKGPFLLGFGVALVMSLTINAYVALLLLFSVVLWEYFLKGPVPSPPLAAPAEGDAVAGGAEVVDDFVGADEFKPKPTNEELYYEDVHRPLSDYTVEESVPSPGREEYASFLYKTDEVRNDPYYSSKRESYERTVDK